VVSYPFASVWGIVVLFSFAGWGELLNRVLFPGKQADWSQKAAWGLALSVAVGGALDLFSWISRRTILIYLAAGFVVWLASLLIRIPKETEYKSPAASSRRKQRLGVALIIPLCFLAFFRYAASVSTVEAGPDGGPMRFDAYDDFQGYLVFPEKMIETGSIGHDPFSYRLLESGLGGQALLQAYFLSALSVKNLHLVDSGLGLLLLLGLLWGECRQREISTQWVVALLFFVLLMKTANVNLTSYYVGASMFLCLYRTLSWRPLSLVPLLSRAIVIALVAAAICSLKSNFIPPCVIFLVSSAGYYLLMQKFERRAILEVVATAAAVLIFLLPWMLAEYQSSGTLLYPLLGKGFDQSVYGNSPSLLSRIPFSRIVVLFAYALTLGRFVGLMALGIAYLIGRRGKFLGREPAFSLFVGAAVAHFILVFATDGYALGRYSDPFLIAAILALMIETLSTGDPSPGQDNRFLTRFLAAAAAAFLLGVSWQGAQTIYVDGLHTLRTAVLNPPIVSNGEVARYRGLQEAVPPGELLLSYLGKPFLLDFKRNTVFIEDRGKASPPPGMPLFLGGESLGRYLRLESIRYVAYSYGDDRLTEVCSPDSLDSQGSFDGWTNACDIQKSLTELASTRKLIYDDGENFVLDLLRPSEAKPKSVSPAGVPDDSASRNMGLGAPSARPHPENPGGLNGSTQHPS
jgi:hypothetical protein